MAEQSRPDGRTPSALGARHAVTARTAPQNRPLVVLLSIGLFAVTLGLLIRLGERTSQLAPDYLSEVVLYALSAACLIMLLALGFLLARNVITLIVERRRAVPFARFRAKLVAAVVGMALIPAVLVFIIGSEVIRNSAERWFSTPIDDVVASARTIARGVYQDQQRALETRASRLAARLAEVDLIATGEMDIRRLVEAQEGSLEGGCHRCVSGCGRCQRGHHQQPDPRSACPVLAARLLAGVGRCVGGQSGVGHGRHRRSRTAEQTAQSCCAPVP